MSKKTTKGNPARPIDPGGFDHVSKEERFLLFIAPALGAARAASCFVLDSGRAKDAWREISTERPPVNLD